MKRRNVLPILIASALLAILVRVMSVAAQTPAEISKIVIEAPTEVSAKPFTTTAYYTIVLDNGSTTPANGTLRVNTLNAQSTVKVGLPGCTVSGVITSCPIVGLVDLQTVPVTVSLLTGNDANVTQCIADGECKTTVVHLEAVNFAYQLYLTIVSMITDN